MPVLVIAPPISEVPDRLKNYSVFYKEFVFMNSTLHLNCLSVLCTAYQFDNATCSGNIHHCFGKVTMKTFCGFDIAEAHTTTA